MANAWRVTRSPSARSSRELPAKPQAPSTRTRTPNPAERSELASARFPFLTVSDSVLRSTSRISAYPASARCAASRARSISSCMVSSLDRFADDRQQRHGARREHQRLDLADLDGGADEQLQLGDDPTWP